MADQGTRDLAGLPRAYVSLYDIIGLSSPSGVMQTMGRMAKFTFPAAGAGGVYAATACLVGDMRGVDGPGNHAIGGLAAGAVIGTQMKHQKWAFVWAIGLAALCSLVKAVRMDGLHLVPQTDPMRSGFMNSHRFSLAGNRPDLTPPTDY